MDLFDQISNDIKEAMKAKDKVRLETLRNVKKVFLEAKTAPGANDVLTDDTALKLMQKLVKQGKDSAESYTNAGRPELAEAEMAQVKVIETYLPKQLSAEELEAKLKDLLSYLTIPFARGIHSFRRRNRFLSKKEFIFLYQNNSLSTGSDFISGKSSRCNL